MDIRDKIINQVLGVHVIEELRAACYFADEIRNFLQEKSLGKRLYMRCGSFAEGMTNHGDIDDMHILDGFLVV